MNQPVARVARSKSRARAATLTPRQLEALRLYGDLGDLNKVATEMEITRQSVKNLLYEARQTLGGMKFTIEAIWVARTKGLI